MILMAAYELMFTRRREIVQIEAGAKVTYVSNPEVPFVGHQFRGTIYGAGREIYKLIMTKLQVSKMHILMGSVPLLEMMNPHDMSLPPCGVVNCITVELHNQSAQSIGIEWLRLIGRQVEEFSK